MAEDIGATMRKRFEERLSGFDPASWNGGDVSILYDVTGDGGGQWTVAIEGGKVVFREGAPASPDVTITASSEHLRAMLEGKLNPLTAQLQGKIQFKGNTPLLFRLRQILG
jgi:putative sterol carrier protein